MFEVRIVNGEGESIHGPFATRDQAEDEKLRWMMTGGCHVNEIREVSPISAAVTQVDFDATAGKISAPAVEATAVDPPKKGRK